MDYQNFKLKKDGPIASIVFDRPDINNTFGAQAWIELDDITNQLIRDSEVRVMILTHTGRHFCTGANLFHMYHELTEGRAAYLATFRDKMQMVGELIRKINMMPKPIIASLNGTAAGAGVSLAMACDFVVVSERTKFYHSFIDINFIPDSGGLWSLATSIGIRKTKELAIIGEPVNAADALSMGMVNKVVPEEGLNETTYTLANKIVSKPPQAIAAIKKMCALMPEMGRDTFIEMEADTMRLLVEDQDCVDRVGAFVAQRKK